MGILSLLKDMKKKSAKKMDPADTSMVARSRWSDQHDIP
jgi:hypothetical protein